MINEDAIRKYLIENFKGIINVNVKKLGSGVQGSGFLLELESLEGVKSYVIKTLLSEGLGHDYPSDRASVFLLDLDEYKNLPKHVRAIDVLSEMHDGTIKSIGGGKEYYLLMEKAEGMNYFYDLNEFSRKNHIDAYDIKKIEIMTSYLAEIHSVRKDSKTLYWRKLRDTIGHGECLMGVLDTYPEGTLSYARMSEIIKKSVDYIYQLKPLYKRLSQIHGDFHPGNIWFKESSSQISGVRSTDFVLLDRSRGPWGEPADDITALTINYIFFSIKNYGDIRGSYLESLTLFFDEYIDKSKDVDITKILAPFFAFRGVVVANPVFYPELTQEQRELIFRFINNVLDSNDFDYQRVNDYL
ncbi:MAG: aminoglycoside phosphotransferase family protein [Nitrospirae bacterium]|nr:aminoglycoside phosphotransferase family protein [Nitrospirota bacterium]